MLKKKLGKLILICTIIFIQFAGLFNVPVTASAPSSAYSLLFEDHFSETSLNTSDWFYRAGDAWGGTNRQENVWVGQDSLHINFKYEDFDNDGTIEYTGGGIISRKNFGYGYYEIRTKLYGASKGLHQSFWSMGTANSADVNAGLMAANNQILEIDGFEVDSAYPNSVGTNSHYYVPSHMSNGSANHSIDTTNWFVMGYEWLPDRLNYYINNQLIRTVVFGRYYAPQNVWLTALATVSGFGGAVPPLTDAQMQVDYFRFFAKKNEGNLIGNSGFDYSYASPYPQNPIGWIETGDKTASTYVSTDYYEGGYALKHYASTAYNVTTKQALDYIPNSNYKLTAYVKSSGGQTEAAMKLAGYGGADLSINIPLSSSWTQITIDNINVTSNKAVISFVSNAKATQWLVVDKVVFADKSEFLPETIIVDNDDAGYEENGTWYDSGVAGYLNSSTRYSESLLGTFVKWTPRIKSAGEYDVYIYKVVYPSNTDTNAKIEIAHKNGINTVNVNYTIGNSGWYYLGKYEFEVGTAGFIKNTLMTELKYARADAVKLVPVVRNVIINHYTVSKDNTITGISSATTLSSMISNIVFEENITYSANDYKNKMISGSDLVGTGTKLFVYSPDFTLFKTYTVIIKGDINGNGEIDIEDLAAIKRHLLKATMLEGCFETAGDIYSKGHISISDLLAVKKRFLWIGNGTEF